MSSHEDATRSICLHNDGGFFKAQSECVWILSFGRATLIEGVVLLECRDFSKKFSCLTFHKQVFIDYDKDGLIPKYQLG